MPHIHTQSGQHDHTVSIYIFRMDFDKPKVMLHLHKKVGTYAQFGGHIELNETPWHAVIHELQEESGYDIGQLEILQPPIQLVAITGAIVHPYPIAHATTGFPGDDSHFHTDSVYAFVTNEEPHNLPAEGESTDMQLFTRAELVLQSEDKVDRITLDTALYIFDNCLNKWRSILPSDFE